MRDWLNTNGGPFGLAAVGMVAALVGLAGATGCSDTEGASEDLGIQLDTEPEETGPDTTTADTGMAEDTGDVDPHEVGGDGSLPPQDVEEECTEGSCGDLETCVNGICIENDVLKCDRAEDLGTLSSGDTVTIDDSFIDYEDDVLDARCASGRGPEKVYRFEVAEDSMVTADPDYPGMFQAKMEFRRDGCLDSGDDDLCYDNSEKEFFVEGGTELHLVVDQDVGRGGDFTIDLSAQSAVCEPETYSCAADNKVQICDQPTGTPPHIKYTCPAGGCQDGRCAGDACSNPIVVNGSTSISGSLDAYRLKYNLADNALCHDRLDEPVKTTGPDVIFKLPGLMEGQTVTIDTTQDSVANAFFVTTSCSEDVTQLTCEEVRTDESEKEWEVPYDGDFFVVVDKFGFSGGEFNYQFEIQ